MTRRGEAWCGEVRCGEVWQGVKVWKMGSARPWPVGPSGLALLKGVDFPSGSARNVVGKLLAGRSGSERRIWLLGACFSRKLNERCVQILFFHKQLKIHQCLIVFFWS